MADIVLSGIFGAARVEMGEIAGFKFGRVHPFFENKIMVDDEAEKMTQTERGR